MKILVAIDLSRASQRVMETARALAKALGATVTVAHVADAELEPTAFEAGHDESRRQLAAELRAEHEAVQAHAGLLRGAGIEATGLLLKGPVIPTLLREIERVGADHVVMGSHGRGALFESLVGSTSAGVVRKASVPVTIVPVRPA